MIHLASKSPRRRLLLDQIGVHYTIVEAPIDEVRQPGEPPGRFVERMACEKARAGLAALGDARTGPVLAADTAVVLDERVLGKPRDAEHAMAMLEALSGRMHQSSSRGESHPSALTEPDLRLSPHPALTLQPPVALRVATGRTTSGPVARCVPTSTSTLVLGV